MASYSAFARLLATEDMSEGREMGSASFDQHLADTIDGSFVV
jgi:hypothetical protein